MLFVSQNCKKKLLLGNIPNDISIKDSISSNHAE